MIATCILKCTGAVLCSTVSINGRLVRKRTSAATELVLPKVFNRNAIIHILMRETFALCLVRYDGI